MSEAGNITCRFVTVLPFQIYDDVFVVLFLLTCLLIYTVCSLEAVDVTWTSEDRKLLTSLMMPSGNPHARQERLLLLHMVLMKATP